MSGTTPDWVLWEEHLRDGAHWSGIVRRGTTLRLLTPAPGANLSMTFFNSEQVLERYNMADTLKAQHTAFLRKGNVCYSDMGRVMCSITEDTCGWHDTISGVSDAALVHAKYGESSFQKQRNAYYKNGQDSLLTELGKHGLGARDLGSTINFFSKVIVADDGAMKFVSGNSKANDFVDLRFEMHALVAVSSCQHPLDPEPVYKPSPINLIAWRSGPAPRNDMCRNLCEENQRGFHNTEVLYR
ncbi:MAG: urea carboxylase-associated family protein [Steroidobacteraceae bacterium]